MQVCPSLEDWRIVSTIVKFSDTGLGVLVEVGMRDNDVVKFCDTFKFHLSCHPSRFFEPSVVQYR